MTEPRTEHGRYVLTTSKLHVLLIEEQAATEARRELLAKVEGLPTSATVWTGEPLVRRSEVLALFEEVR